jgi:enoyl-CoA hydratase
MGLIIESEGPVLVVTMDRPAARNAVDPAQAQRLREAFERFERNDEAKVAVLTGANGVFCAGYDLKSLSAGTGASKFEYEPEGEGPMGPSRRLLAKPVIAAVEGHAVAGGLELALWCDLRVAAETAVFGVFCRRWGVPLVDGGTVRLPRIVGMSRALDMILTGRAVSAREAHEWGLANRLVPEGQARAEAVKLAKEIARFPELCMRTDRASAYRQWGMELPSALKMEGREGLAPLLEGARDGAARFASGKGRGGDFGEI